MTLLPVITTHLEISHPGQLCRRGKPHEDLKLMRAEVPLPELNRFLYATVGRDWAWTDRLRLTREQWIEYIARPELETWVAYLLGTPAGYFELELQSGNRVEIRIFGILPEFTGQGIGGYLLTQAVERGWELGAERVWLHTCTLDHPAALANYLRRGFRIFRRETTTKDMPEQTHWPG